VQRQFGVHQPDFGVLWADRAYGDREPIPREHILQPRVEAEVALILDADIGSAYPGPADLIRAIGYVVPSIEVVGSRIEDWRIGLVDTIADNASSGGVVLGSTPVRLDAVDLRLSGCVLTRDGDIVGTGAGGAVLGSPLSCLVWLANALGARGAGLEAGHVVLPGSITAAVAVTPGSTVTARFAGIGSVTTRFASEDT